MRSSRPRIAPRLQTLRRPAAAPKHGPGLGAARPRARTPRFRIRRRPVPACPARPSPSIQSPEVEGRAAPIRSSSGSVNTMSPPYGGSALGHLPVYTAWGETWDQYQRTPCTVRINPHASYRVGGAAGPSSKFVLPQGQGDLHLHMRSRIWILVHGGGHLREHRSDIDPRGRHHRLRSPQHHQRGQRGHAARDWIHPPPLSWGPASACSPWAFRSGSRMPPR